MKKLYLLSMALCALIFETLLAGAMGYLGLHVIADYSVTYIQCIGIYTAYKAMTQTKVSYEKAR